MERWPFFTIIQEANNALLKPLTTATALPGTFWLYVYATSKQTLYYDLTIFFLYS